MLEIPTPPPQLLQLAKPSSSWEQLMFSWFQSQSSLVKGLAFFQVETGKPAHSRGRKGAAVVKLVKKLAQFGDPSMDLEKQRVDQLLNVFNRPDNNEIYLFNSKFLVAVGDRRNGLYLQRSVLDSLETDPQQVTCLKIVKKRKPHPDLDYSDDFSGEYDEAQRHLFVLFSWSAENQSRECNKTTSQFADWLNIILNEEV